MIGIATATGPGQVYPRATISDVGNSMDILGTLYHALAVFWLSNASFCTNSYHRKSGKSGKKQGGGARGQEARGKKGGNSKW